MHQQLTKAERMNDDFQSPATHEKDERVLEHATLLSPTRRRVCAYVYSRRAFDRQAQMALPVISSFLV
jgi:hypothetical protein